MKMFDPTLAVPEGIARKAAELRVWMNTHGAESVGGLGNVHDLQHKLDQATESGSWLLAAAIALRAELAAVTRERDQYKSMCEVADALRNRERGL